MDRVLSEQLSRMVSEMNYFGYILNDKDIEWRDVTLKLNFDYMLRIIDNVMSNIYKYADKEREIKMSLIYEKERVGVFFENYIGDYEREVKGNRIGLVNIRLFMGQMNGKAEHEEGEDTFKLWLWFPIYDE